LDCPLDVSIGFPHSDTSLVLPFSAAKYEAEGDDE